MIKSAIASTGESYYFKIIKEEAERDSEQVMEELNYCFVEEKKHRDKFKRGEIDDIRFPPEAKN